MPTAASYQPVSAREDRVKIVESVEQVELRITELSQRFYTHLFRLMPRAEAAFRGSHAFRQRKFANLFLTFRSIKYLDIVAPTIRKMGLRHEVYFRQYTPFFEPMLEALILALRDTLGPALTAELEQAWRIVFKEVAALMQEDTPGIQPDRDLVKRLRNDEHLLEDIGGADIIEKVHDRFYNIMLEDPWLSQFFGVKPHSFLVQKQTEFMVSAFGGPHIYRGATPAFVHQHMLVTEEEADLRERILGRTILSFGLSAEIADRWLDVDRSYRPSIVKSDVSECILVNFGQAPIKARKPLVYVEPDI